MFIGKRNVSSSQKYDQSHRRKYTIDNKNLYANTHKKIILLNTSPVKKIFLDTHKNFTILSISSPPSYCRPSLIPKFLTFYQIFGAFNVLMIGPITPNLQYQYFFSLIFLQNHLFQSGNCEYIKGKLQGMTLFAVTTLHIVLMEKIFHEK